MKRIFNPFATTALSAALLCGCNTTPPIHDTCPIGFSGMTAIDASRYLVVHDVKTHRDGVRFSVINTNNERNITVDPVEVFDWKHEDGRGNDLESVCKIPGRTSEFLAAESGHWGGKYGRIFHIRLEPSQSAYQASVIHAYDLPEFDAKGPDDPHGDEFEGMECVSLQNGEVMVLLAERGGSPVYPEGLIRWFLVNTDNQSLAWTSAGQTGKPVNAPGTMDQALNHRDIAALHLDENNNLWGVAAEESGESGPFNSFVYEIGTVQADPNNPVTVRGTTVTESVMSGLKTEALAGPTDQIPASRFSVGTEDECLGGIWRPLK